MKFFSFKFDRSLKRFIASLFMIISPAYSHTKAPASIFSHARTPLPLAVCTQSNISILNLIPSWTSLFKHLSGSQVHSKLHSFICANCVVHKLLASSSPSTNLCSSSSLPSYFFSINKSKFITLLFDLLDILYGFILW